MKEGKRLPQLCHADKCTACSACYSVCPAGAITLVEDAVGELHPNVDPDVCIGCGLCEKMCPENGVAQVARYGKPVVYCCWLKDADKRRESTSGGAAYAISAAVIGKGGHVWGAAYDANLSVRYTEANTLAELAPIQKSKYVQSYVADAFKAIKRELDAGDLVLFTGTGCHVKGLRSFLRKDYDNLITVDLVCHGVPGQGVFMKYKRWLEDRYQDKLNEYLPRHKRASDGQETTYCSLARFANKGDVKLELDENSYFTGFQHNLFLRANCYDCQANGEERFADITVADFWGLGKMAPFADYKQRTLGISMLALNSEKARAFFHEFSGLVEYEERTYAEACCTNTQYYRSAKPSPRREEFRREYPGATWDALSAKYMKLSGKEMILYGVKKFTPPNLLLYVKLLAKWIK